jgi:hypoxia up-regulated 1
MDKLDQNRAAREEALNSLEAYIYRSREFLEDNLFQKVSSEEQRKSFKAKLEEASEWLWSSDSATLEHFKAKLAELTYVSYDFVDNRDIEGPISKRKAEHLARPERIELLQQILNSTKSLIKSSREIVSEVYPPKNNEDDLDDETPAPTPPASPFQLDEKSLSKLDQLASDVETWLKEKLAAQESLELWEEPVLLTSELEKKGTQIQAALRKALLDQAKPKPKSKTSSSSTSTATGSQTDSTATSSAAASNQTDTPVYSEVDEEPEETVTTTITSTVIDDEAEPTSGEIKHEEL